MLLSKMTSFLTQLMVNFLRWMYHTRFLPPKMDAQLIESAQILDRLADGLSH